MENQKYIGLTVSEATRKYKFTDEVELVSDLMVSEEGQVAIINKSMSQDDIDAIVKLPYSLFISDSIYANTEYPHPRLNGSFPKVIREYVLERELISIEEAIKKMTYMPAKVMGFQDRGLIKEGYKADINIFDPNQFKDNATFDHPNKMATGLDYCIINGQIVLTQGEIIDREAGDYIFVN